MPQNLCAQIVCPSPKHFDEKRLDWASVVRDMNYFKVKEEELYDKCILCVVKQLKLFYITDILSRSQYPKTNSETTNSNCLSNQSKFVSFFSCTWVLFHQKILDWLIFFLNSGFEALEFVVGSGEQDIYQNIQLTGYGRTMKPFSLKSRTFGLGQTNWADKFWGIWGLFG
jgi:hypothetical protein